MEPTIGFEISTSNLGVVRIQMHPLGPSITRILKVDRKIAGHGFLIGRGLVCTCAHVVCDALGVPRDQVIKLGSEVAIDFPYFRDSEIETVVEYWLPVSDGDVAILRAVQATPNGARPARLTNWEDAAGRRYGVYGSLSLTSEGRWSFGTAEFDVANGWIQLVAEESGVKIQKGFSGGPIWDVQQQKVMGMVVAVDRAEKTGVSFGYPASKLRKITSELGLFSSKLKYGELTAGLAALPSNLHTRMEQFLHEYLGDGGVRIPFGGRSDQIEKLYEWLADDKAPYALIAAEAGRGKSSLITNWALEVAETKLADVVFCPISIRFETASKSRALSLLGGRLRYVLGSSAPTPKDTDTWLVEIESALRDGPGDDRLVLLILDGLDEATDWFPGKDLPFPRAVGGNIKVLVSARLLADRDALGWLQYLNLPDSASVVPLPPLSIEAVQDVLDRMDDQFGDVDSRNDLASHLHRLSEGDPLLIRLYIDALQRGRDGDRQLQIESLESLNPGLESFFDKWWEDQRMQWSAQGLNEREYEANVREFLSLAAVALGPVLLEDVREISSSHFQDTLSVRSVATFLGRFLIGDGRTTGYVFSHPRLAQFFFDSMSKSAQEAWNVRFVEFGLRAWDRLVSGELIPSEASSYAISSLGAHLDKGDFGDEVYFRLIGPEWLQAWEAVSGDFDGFLEDMNRAWRRADLSARRERDAQGVAIETIALQHRFALVGASIHTQFAQVDPALLESLIKSGAWTRSQGLAHVRQIPSEAQRVESLSRIAPLLNESLIIDALGSTLAYSDPEARTQAIASLTPHLPGRLVKEALTVAQTLPDAHRAKSLSKMISFLSEDLQEDAVALLRGIDSEDTQANALTEMMPYLSSQLHRCLLSSVHSEEASAYRISIVGPLLEPMQELEVAEYLRGKWDVTDSQLSIGAFRSAKERIDWRRVEKLKIITRPFREERIRAKILLSLSPMLGQDEVDEAISALDGIVERTRIVGILSELVKVVPDDQHRRLYEIALRDDNGDAKSEALNSLIPSISETLIPELVQSIVNLPESLKINWHAADGVGAEQKSVVNRKRIEGLAAIVSRSGSCSPGAGIDAEGLCEIILTQACRIEDTYTRSKIIESVVADLPENLLLKALDAGGPLGKFDLTDRCLLAIAGRVIDSGREYELFDWVADNGSHDWRLEFVTKLHAMVPPDTMVHQIRQLELGSETRQQLARMLEKELSSFAPSETTVDTQDLRVGLVDVGETTQFESDSHDSERVLAAVPANAWSRTKVAVLRRVLLALPEDKFELAITFAEDISDDDWKVEAFLAILSYAPVEMRDMLIDRATEACWKVSIGQIKSQLFSDIADLLSGEERRKVLLEAVSAVRNIEDFDAFQSAEEKIEGYVVMEGISGIRQWVRRQFGVSSDRKDEFEHEQDSVRRALLSESDVCSHLEMNDRMIRARLLISDLPHVRRLYPHLLYLCWEQVLRDLGQMERGELLASTDVLAETAVVLGGRQVPGEMRKSLRHIQNWFP